MSRMELLDPNLPEYARAFKTLLQCTDERLYTKQLLADLFSAFPYEAVAVDWGAGAGTLTREMAQWFRTVFAVEPNAEMLGDFSEECPNVIGIPTPIEETTIPKPVDVGVISHLLHAIPNARWGDVCKLAASQLSEGGMLVVILKHVGAASGQMHEAFGAPRIRLNQVFASLEQNPEYNVTSRSTPGRFRTTTFEATLSAARCMMSDRPRDVYSKLPTESEFREYVRTHFWNETTQQGGWDCPQQFVLIHRNPFYSFQKTQPSSQSVHPLVMSGDRAMPNLPACEFVSFPSFPALLPDSPVLVGAGAAR